jgi:hypothetical protein
MDVNGSNEVVCADFARQLERELAELREWKMQAMLVMPDFQQIGTELGLTIGDNVCAEILPGIRRLNRELAEAQDRIDDLTATGIHSCGDDCKRPNCVLRRELAEATKQRDELARIIRDIRAGYGGQMVDPDCACDDCEFLAKLDSALATLEGSVE